MHGSVVDVDFEKIFNLFSIPLFIYDELGYLKYANVQCLNLLNQNLKNILDQHVDAIFSISKKGVSAIDGHSMPEVVIFDKTFVMRKFSLSYMEQPTLTGCTLEDITQLEKEHEKAQKLAVELDESHRNTNKYYNIFEYSNDAIMLLSKERFLECNQAALNMFACSTKEEFTRYTPSDLSPEFQENGSLSMVAEAKYIEQAFTEGKALFEWTHKKLTGEIFPAEVLLTPFRWEGKKLLQATVRDISEIKKLHEDLLLLSSEDSLTKLYNRRYMEQTLQAEFYRSRRTEEVFSLMMIDIDHFKNINDQFGHPVGDHVLQNLAECLKHKLRKIDIKTRIGGEEFLIILPNTDENQAYTCAEKIRTVIAEVSKTSKNLPSYTISAGITEFKTKITDKNILLNQVDIALYQAKKAGRNQTVIFSEK